MSQLAPLPDLEMRLKTLLVERLKLEVAVDDIDSTTPLFGPEGLGLDSIDALELVLGVEQDFKVSIEDEEVGTEALESVRTLAHFVRTREQASA
ncbi:MAG: phosphopantetheine-binding protein [Acidobacteriota bacterium]